MKIFLYILIIVIVLYCLPGAYFYFKQNKLLYHPNKDVYETPDAADLEYEDLYLTTQDSIKINSWYIPAKDSSAKTILFCHGNAGNISHRLETIEIFHNMGLNVLIFDYRGFGKSEGKPSEKGTYEDALAAWTYLIKDMKCKPDDIIIFGRSLGGAIATNLATKVKPSCLIIESTFTSVPDIAQKMFPIFPVNLLVKNKYPSINIIPKVKCPVLVIHSQEDQLIPYSNGVELFEKATAKKQFLEITGGHNEGYMESGKVYTDGIKQFIANL
jgi:uncharacterized protein